MGVYAGLIMPMVSGFTYVVLTECCSIACAISCPRIIDSELSSLRNLNRPLNTKIWPF
jgi:hypothetical protein